MIPTVLRYVPYRSYLYSHEPSEPPHVQVDRDDLSARFWLGPVSLEADLPSNRQLGCMVQVPSPTSSWLSLAVPTVTFVAQADEVQPVWLDIGAYYSHGTISGTLLRDNVLLDLSAGEIVKIPPLAPCSPECSYFGIVLHPEVAEATPIYYGIPGGSISVTGLSAGTTTIKVYGVLRDEFGTPDGWVIKKDTALIGAIGVRVSP